MKGGAQDKIRKQTKKALIVTTVSGFVPQFEMNNVRILQELGYEVHYASNFRNPSYGMDNSRLSGTGLICHQIDMERSPFRVCSLWKAYRQLKILMRKTHFELIHCHTPVGGALGRLAAKSVLNSTYNQEKSFVIYTAHGFHFYRGASALNWLLYYPVERWLARYTDVLVTINEEDYARAKRFCQRKRTLVRHIPGTGIDIEAYRYDEAARRKLREGLGIGEDQLLLLSVGELNRNKNHRTVIRALAGEKESRATKKRDSGNTNCTNQNAVLGKGMRTGEEAGTDNIFYAVCGEGKRRRTLSRTIRRYGLEKKVFLLGYRKDIRQMLSAADVFVLPSFREGFSRSLQEAMAAARPVLASDIRGNRELIDEGRGGWLVAPGDARAFRRVLHGLPGKREMLENAGAYNEEKIKGYSGQAVGDRMKKIYGKIQGRF